MQKKYIVRLSKRERELLEGVIKKLQGSSQKVRRAHVLHKADAAGPAWSDQRIAEAFGCRRQTVEGIRQRFVEAGFEETLEGKQRPEPATEKLLDGKQRPKSSRCVWGRRRKVTPIGRCDYWPAGWSS
jgi:Homeodomain-like domain